MKCYAKRHALASDAMNAAQLVTKQLLEEQSDRIAARCYNEAWCAMLQANLSPRTIAHVQKASPKLYCLSSMVSTPRRIKSSLTMCRMSRTPICG